MLSDSLFVRWLEPSMLSTRLPRSRITRLALLLGSALFLSACSHDRYLFLERAELDQLAQQQAQQLQRIEALETQSREQFDLIETRQQIRQQALMDRLNRQQALIQALPTQQVSLIPPSPLDGAEPSARLKGKLVVGETEPIYIADPGVVYTARIDSGATTSSMHAVNIQRFERDGQPWVRFDINVPGRADTLTMEHEISRRARIIQSNTEDPERRIVVELPFVIGDYRDVAEFTLSDRSHLTYPVLVGRNILRDIMLIDVGQEFVTELPEGLPAINGAKAP
jgi:hypothetical protein